MNKRTVIIISSSNQTQWALKYLKYHKKENVYLLATTISTQIALKREGYNPFTYSELIKNADKNLDYYSPKQEKNTLHLKAVNVTNKILNYLQSNKFFYRNISLAMIVRYPLCAEIEKIYYFYDLCKNIDQKYKPTKVLIELHNHTYLNPASKIFTDRLRTYHCENVNLRKLNVLNYFSTKFSVLCDKIISLHTIKGLTKNKQIIFQSGGHILYYFHNWINLLHNQRPNISYLLLTFKQTCKDNFLLLKQGIYPLNHIYLNSNQFLRTNNEFKILEKSLMSQELTSLLDLDKSLYDLIQAKLFSYISKNLKQLISNIDKAFLIFAKIKPKLFITTHDPGLSSMPFVLTAKELGIKTMQIQHGLYMYSSEADYNCDIAAVWGKITKKYLVKKYKKNNVQVIGFPGFAQFKRNTNIQNSDKKVFSVLTTVYGHEENHLNKFLHDLFPVLAKYPQFTVRIRTHPGQDITGYKELASYYGLERLIINPPLSIQNFIQTSSIILSMDTTLILWAMRYHKPLFHTSVYWGKTIFPTHLYKAAWIPQNPLDLSKKIGKYIANPLSVNNLKKGQNRFLEDFTSQIITDPSQKLKELIFKLI